MASRILLGKVREAPIETGMHFWWFVSFPIRTSSIALAMGGEPYAWLRLYGLERAFWNKTFEMPDGEGVD
jgi:hypothetical protein